MEPVAGELVGHGDDGDLDHVGVLLDRLLDDLGADADPAHLDVEVAAALERERAVVVAADDVARCGSTALAAAVPRDGRELLLVQRRR